MVKHQFPSFEWHWTYILTGLDLWNVWTLEKFGRHCSQSCVYSDETTWRSGKHLLKTPGNAISNKTIVLVKSN